MNSSWKKEEIIQPPSLLWLWIKCKQALWVHSGVVWRRYSHCLLWNHFRPVYSEGQLRCYLLINACQYQQQVGHCVEVRANQCKGQVHKARREDWEINEIFLVIFYFYNQIMQFKIKLRLTIIQSLLWLVLKPDGCNNET